MLAALRNALSDPGYYWQVAVVVAAALLGWLISSRLRRLGAPHGRLQRALTRWERLLRPWLTLLFLLVAAALCRLIWGHDGVVRGALLLNVLWLIESTIRHLQVGLIAAPMLRLLVFPLISLHMLGWLSPINTALTAMSIQVGNLHLTVSGLLRVLVFGALLFWAGWMANTAGMNAIRGAQRLDLRSREVVAKLFQILLGVVVVMLLLQVMGINLTALAVFGGALGVGLGFGLQSIASNFVSGLIILFDRSLSVGDYVEITDGQCGYVRELTLRYTTLESFDGKDILVPNDTFITTPFTNWTHQNHKQRYRVEFSVAYATDIRALCELMRKVVASHPQVISGPQVPMEERPDCEIDSFGDSGVNMFIEFWMDGIDDGRNRVGGDLLLLIFEALREKGIEIPFPQREVRLIRAEASRPQPSSTITGA